ncbi:MAG: hypothetical protein AAB834_03150 [Patescibacteria group bacterium]
MDPQKKVTPPVLDEEKDAPLQPDAPQSTTSNTKGSDAVIDSTTPSDSPVTPPDVAFGEDTQPSLASEEPAASAEVKADSKPSASMPPQPDALVTSEDTTPPPPADISVSADTTPPPVEPSDPAPPAEPLVPPTAPAPVANDKKTIIILGVVAVVLVVAIAVLYLV